MVLQNTDMDQSDDDHSFVLIDSDDLPMEKTDHSDTDSFDLLGSEELNSLREVVEELVPEKPEENELGNSDPKSDTDQELNFPRNDMEELLPVKTEENELGYADPKSDDTFVQDEHMDVPDGDCDEFIDSEKEHAAKRKCLSDMYVKFNPTKFDVYRTTDGTVIYDFPANVKLNGDVEIKDVAKDHILPYLPAKSLLRFRSVSKEWDKWITSPFLGHKQSCYFQDLSGFFCQMGDYRSFVALDWSAHGIPDPNLNFLPQKVKVKNSCNGLLVCRGNSENVYYVCNPVNKEYHVLPQSGYYHGEEPNVVLVFEPSPMNLGADYQVVVAFDVYHGPPIICFEIYSSETRSWSCSATDCAEIGYFALKENGLYMNGVAFWETSSGDLLAFDVKNDICGIQPIPCERKFEGILSSMDGELSYIQAYIPACWGDEVNNKCIIEFYGGANMCLKRQIISDLEFAGFGIYGPPSCRVLMSVNNNTLIFCIGDLFYSFNVSDQKFERINSRGGMYSSMDLYIPYVNSLVSLPRSSD